MAASSDSENSSNQTIEERIQDQEKRIFQLERQLHEMELSAQTEKPTGSTAAPDLVETGDIRRDQANVTTASELASSTFPGSWPMFGTDFRMKIGGYFKADALYDVDGTGDEYQFLISQIPVSGTLEDGRAGYFNMFVRETRFNFDVRKSEGEYPQKFFLEMDFFDESSFSPRLRHAYYQYGHLLVGQTWTILTELRAINYMLDFAYGDAIFGGRSVQVRWEQPINEQWSWMAGLENLSDPAIDSQGAVGVASSKYPLLAGRMTYEDDSTLFTFGGMVDQLRWDGEGVGPDATATGWAVIMGGRQTFGPRDDYVAWSLSYGDGAGGNIAALAGQNTNATLLPDGTLETNKTYNVSLGYTHNFTDKLATNLNYAWVEVATNSRPVDSIKKGSNAHANLIYKIWKSTFIGIEYMWGQRTNVSGADGTATRVQTSLQFNY